MVLCARLLRAVFAKQVSEFSHLSRSRSCLRSIALRMGRSICGGGDTTSLPAIRTH